MIIPFGAHIISFNGGLGNQMFEYAFYLALKRGMPFRIYGFDISGSISQHYGYELDKIFQIDTILQRKIYPKLRKLERHRLIRFEKCSEQNCWQYEKGLLQKRFSPTEYVGFWQTEKYFKCIENKVRQVFRFRTELLNEKTIALAKELSTNENSISLHVRRGDYVNIDNCQTYGQSYYLDALEYMRRCTGGGKMIIFSDDIDWCRANLSMEDALYVDWNNGVDSWQDMYLMSLCKNNIIANSSFSWWGAWLNENPNKIVIAPKQWMKSDVGVDVIPKSWIRI